MTCQRCHGLMVEDHLLDMEESYGRPWIRGWRCVSCGDVVDPVIKRRRLMEYNGDRRLVGSTGGKKKRVRVVVPLGA